MYPFVDGQGSVDAEAYSADIMSGKKRVRHLRSPVVRDYEGQRYVVIIDGGEAIALYRVVAGHPWTPERLLTWPFSGDDVGPA
jgi:hypothetical protein